MKLNLILGLAALSIVAIAPSVSAQVVLSKDSTNRLYVSGLQANTEYPLTMTSSNITRRLLANQCGLITVPAPNSTNNNPASFVVVDGSIVNPASLEIKAIPRCSSTNGVYSLDIAAPANFVTPRGQTILVNKSPNLAIEIQIESPRLRNFTTDACGILRVTNSATFPVTNGSNIAVGDSNNPLFFGAVPGTESTPPLCFEGVKYTASAEFPL